MSEKTLPTDKQSTSPGIKGDSIFQILVQYELEPGSEFHWSGANIAVQIEILGNLCDNFKTCSLINSSSGFQTSPPPSYHSAEDNASRHRLAESRTRFAAFDGDAESTVTGGDAGATSNAFSALDDAVAGFTSNDDTQSHVATSLVDSRRSESRRSGAAANMDDLDLESDIQINQAEDDLSNNSDLESDVQRNSRVLGEDGNEEELDSDDSGSGRKVSAFRPATPKPGAIKRGKVIKRSVGGSPYRDSVIGNNDPSFNSTMVF